MPINRTARNYLRAVRRRIPLRDMRARVMKTLVPACELFAAEQPDADRTEYYERFGTPKQIAKDALENAEPDVLYRGLTRTRKIWIIVLIDAALVVGGFWVAYALCLHDVRDTKSGSSEDAPVCILYEGESK